MVTYTYFRRIEYFLMKKHETWIFMCDLGENASEYNREKKKKIYCMYQVFVCSGTPKIVNEENSNTFISVCLLHKYA